MSFPSNNEVSIAYEMCRSLTSIRAQQRAEDYRAHLEISSFARLFLLDVVAIKRPFSCSPKAWPATSAHERHLQPSCIDVHGDICPRRKSWMCLSMLPVLYAWCDRQGLETIRHLEKHRRGENFSRSSRYRFATHHLSSECKNLLFASSR